ENDFKVLALLLEFFDELWPAHAWHHDVSDHNIQLADVLLDHAERFRSIAGLQHGIAKALQRLRGQGSQRCSSSTSRIVPSPLGAKAAGNAAFSWTAVCTAGR